MKAIQIIKRRGKALLTTVPIPKRQPHEILVEVHYSPIHPADLATATGNYPEKEYPLILGLEASGIIVEAPRQELIGKKVACYNKSGCWSEYIVPTLFNILPDEVNMDQGSLLTLNPITALIMKKLTYNQSFIINAANSSLASILARITANQNPVCIARNLKGKEKIYENGCKYALDSTVVDFKYQL